MLICAELFIPPVDEDGRERRAYPALPAPNHEQITADVQAQRPPPLSPISPRTLINRIFLTDTRKRMGMDATLAARTYEKVAGLASATIGKGGLVDRSI